MRSAHVLQRSFNVCSYIAKHCFLTLSVIYVLGTKLPKFCLQFSNQGAVICKASNPPLSKEETENLYLVTLVRLFTGSALCFNEVSLTNSCSSLLFIPRALEQIQHKLIHLNHSKTLFTSRLSVQKFCILQIECTCVLRLDHRTSRYHIPVLTVFYNQVGVCLLRGNG
jgi:hypothetical protein